MVRHWLDFLFTPTPGCGPLCRSVQNEVASIGRAEALARQSRKRNLPRKGTRES